MIRLEDRLRRRLTRAHGRHRDARQHPRARRARPRRQPRRPFGPARDGQAAGTLGRGGRRRRGRHPGRDPRLTRPAQPQGGVSGAEVPDRGRHRGPAVRDTRCGHGGSRRAPHSALPPGRQRRGRRMAATADGLALRDGGLHDQPLPLAAVPVPARRPGTAQCRDPARPARRPGRGLRPGRQRQRAEDRLRHDRLHGREQAAAALPGGHEPRHAAHHPVDPPRRQLGQAACP